MSITPEQVILIGLLAAFVAQAVKLAATYFSWQIDRKGLTIGLFAVAVALAYIWAAPALPAFPAMDSDPAVFGGAVVGWIGNIVSVASVIVGFATIIYNLLLVKVFDMLGWTKEKVISGKE
jgi:hypothetical protein